MKILYPEIINSVLQHPLVSRIRRNHALEHATLHVLGQKLPRTSMAGHSDMGGFWIIGDVHTDDLWAAVTEAQQRLNAGESHLAVHPNCGTNLATAGMLATIAGLSGMAGSGPRFRDKLERLPFSVALATLALVVSRPVGYLLQAQVTTCAELDVLQVTKIRVTRRGWLRAHRVATKG